MKDYRVVEVRFIQDCPDNPFFGEPKLGVQSYFFKTNIWPLKKMDIVVCHTSNNGYHQMSFARVVDPDAQIDFVPTKWIIDTIDLSDHISRMRHEKELIDKMDREFSKTDKIAMYRFMAQSHPNMAKLVKEYDGYDDNECNIEECDNNYYEDDDMRF